MEKEKISSHNGHSSPNTTSVLFTNFFIIFIVIIAVYFSRSFLFSGIAELFVAVVYLATVYFCLWVVTTFVSVGINYVYRKKNQMSREHIDNFIIGINKLTGFIHLLFFIIFAAGILGVDITKILASTAIILAVVGLAFRDYILNFISGINIMFSGKFKLGEYIKIGENKGKITDLTFSHVQLLTDAKDVVFVPNNIVTSSSVINHSKSNIKKVFAEFSFSIDRCVEHKDLMQKVVLHVTEKFWDVLSNKDGVKVNIESVENNNIRGNIEFEVSHYNFELERKIKNYTAEVIINALNERSEVVKKTPKIKSAVNKVAWQ